MKGIEYRVGHRYDYWAIDLYIDDEMKKTIRIRLGKKEAEELASALMDATRVGYDYLVDKI